jgi:iron(III) transport system permease protein
LTARALLARPRFRLANLPALLAALFIGAPVMVVLIAGLFWGGGDHWVHIRETLLTGYIGGTLGTLALTGTLILAIGVPAAWLVTMYRFPGRGLFEWLLILPLAAPGYVFAYAFADLLGIAGPVQTLLRDTTGLSARDYWFPEIHSLPGLAFVLAATLYPYVYLTARAAFTSQSICALEAARSLGASPARSFWKVALPAARATIIAGLALALMEAAADYGAAEHLGVPTLTFGVVRAWDSFGSPSVAARLALVLLTIVLALTLLERANRGRKGSQQSSTRWRVSTRATLSPRRAALATLFCTAIFTVCFVLPVGRLIWLSVETRETIAPLGDAFRNTIILAGSGACLAFGLALIIALSMNGKGPLARLARLAAASGYAIPGAVLALGGLVLLKLFGWQLAGLSAIAMLAWVYASRFTAAGAEPMRAALSRAPRSMGHAARSLGASPLRKAKQVDLPIAMSGAAAGALILFVEALKELPATLMLRPFNWDTLSVRAYAYASDERLAAAAMPSLLITLAGLVPVLLLSRQLARARPGQFKAPLP